MRHTSTTAILAFVVLVTASGALLAADTVKVVGNPGTTPDIVSQRDLQRVFYKQTSKWPDGQPAEPLDQPRSSPLRKAFIEEVLGKTVAQVESHWQTQVFSGRSGPPAVLASDGDVLEYVRRTPGAVGYVSADGRVDEVKVITVRV
jgi:ABC-type phosphate transport system substrate-binding protein